MGATIPIRLKRRTEGERKVYLQGFDAGCKSHNTELADLRAKVEGLVNDLRHLIACPTQLGSMSTDPDIPTSGMVSTWELRAALERRGVDPDFEKTTSPDGKTVTIAIPWPSDTHTAHSKTRES